MGGASAIKRERKLELQKSRILDSAQACIFNHGYTRTTIRSIADTAGVSNGSVQYYFAERSDILLAVYERLHQRLIDRLAVDLTSTGRKVTVLRKAINTHLTWARSEENVVRLCLELAAQTDPQFALKASIRLKACQQELRKMWLDPVDGVGIKPQSWIELVDLITHAANSLGLAVILVSPLEDKGAQDLSIINWHQNLLSAIDANLVKILYADQ
jgi:AcrR family transcriptional regulator